MPIVVFHIPITEALYEFAKSDHFQFTDNTHNDFSNRPDQYGQVASKRNVFAADHP